MAITFNNLGRALGTGICCGIAEFVWHTTAQKMGMIIAGLEFEPSCAPGDDPLVLGSEVLDKEFVSSVIGCPIGEEVVFRGLLQKALTQGITFCFPQLQAPSPIGISKASLLSVVTIGVGFGLAHYPDYKKGGAFPSTMAAIAGIIYGVVREKFGLTSSIAAHMASNLSTGLLDKYWTTLLEMKWEKELKLQRS